METFPRDIARFYKNYEVKNAHPKEASEGQGYVFYNEIYERKVKLKFAFVTKGWEKNFGMQAWNTPLL